jgi:hypothetical protein
MLAGRGMRVLLTRTDNLGWDPASTSVSTSRTGHQPTP